MSEGSADGLSLRDLMLELRADVRSIDMKLDNKADRSRVHELVNTLAVVQLERAAERITRDQQAKDISDLQQRQSSLEAWRNRLVGMAVVLGAFSGAILARVLGAF